MPKTDTNAQILLHDKRLKTEKKEKKENRKRLFRMKDHENVKKTDVKVRSTKRSGVAKDKRKLLKSDIQEETQNYDFGERESTRPYRPELNYSGKAKRRNKRNPNKEEADFSGQLKHSSTIQKPQRGVSTPGGEKGKSARAIEKDFRALSIEMHQYPGNFKPSSKRRKFDYTGKQVKGQSERAKERSLKRLSRERHQYSGNLKYSSSIVKKGRVGANYSGKVSKGRSQKSKDKDFRALSLEMHQYAGNIKVVKDRQGKESSFSGRIKIPSLSSKTRHFKRLSKEMNQFEGHIRVKRSKKENLHPSVSYLEGKRKNSYRQKEKLRKRKIMWFRLFKKNSDQPKSVKEKPDKPKYDSRESEIWYE